MAGFKGKREEERGRERKREEERGRERKREEERGSEGKRGFAEVKTPSDLEMHYLSSELYTSSVKSSACNLRIGDSATTFE